MNIKVIVAIVVLAAGLMLGVMNFMESNVEYADFNTAEQSGRKVQVKGVWMKDLESGFNAEKAQFTFYMKDDNQRIMKVVLEGAKPNNFELAESVVAKGRHESDHFHATEVLTKCPSKYEGDAEAVKNTL
ncbi:MAG: cytochrome c maturation protein CcmE [Ignavibacteriales bacterium]|jgi:cytochrome c-type biogenesis protein CcmE|nr:cytochrome c maturation protein CcmE [Ignavibacteriales bacterium]